MRALLIDGVPGLETNAGGSYAVSAVSGTKVYCEQVVKALFKYGTYDAYFFLGRNPFSPISPDEIASLVSADPRARVVFVPELEMLQSYDDVVLLSLAGYIASLIPLRSTPHSCRWIISGVIHSLDGWNMPYLPLTLIHSDVDHADSLFCSTNSGRLVLEKLFSAIGFAQQVPLSLPIVPLGTDCEAYTKLNKQDVRRKLGIPLNAMVLLYVGRFSPLSKCDLWPLLRIFARAACRHTEALLIIAGDDNQHQMADLLRYTAHSMGCSRNVIVTANISDSDKQELFASADIFVSPSDNIQETFGLSVVEAMAAGLPVIASDWNGYRELVTHGITGFCVPTNWLTLGRAVDLLASNSFLLRNYVLATNTIVDLDAAEFYLNLLIENSELRKRMGDAARRIAQERFDWSVVIRRYEEIWNASLCLSQARRFSRAVFGRCPSHYFSQDVFGHYPTRVLESDTIVILTETGRRSLEKAQKNEFVGFNAVTNVRDLQILLETASRLGPSPINKLATYLARDGGLFRIVALSCVAFAIKYGFLSPEAQDGVLDIFPQ